MDFLIAFLSGAIATGIGVMLYRVVTKNKKKEEMNQLELSNLIVNSIPRFIACDDMCGNNIYLSPYACTLFGYPKGTLLSLADTHDDESGRLLNEKAIPIVRQGNIWNGESRVKCADGRLLDVRQTIFPLIDQFGNQCGIGATMTDITEEKSLQKTMHIQHAILESTDNFIVAFDLNFKIIYVSPASYAMSGYSPDELDLDLSPELLHDAETAKQVREYFNAALEGRYIKNKFVLISKSGVKIDVDHQIFPLKDAEGVVQGIGVIMQDISERVINEKQLAKMSALVNSAPQYIAYVNNEGKFDFVNPAANDITGFTNEELMEGGLKILYSDETNERISKEILPKIFDSGKYDFEIPLVRKDGEVRMLSFSAFKIELDEYACGTVASDITGKKILENEIIKAKEAAEAANLAKSRFLSNMSHEIRTPMNAIIGMSELLMLENLNERQKKYVNDIKISSISLLSIINEILDFSKIEVGKLQLLPISFNLHGFLYDLESMFRLIANQKGLEFILEMQEGLPLCVFGDDIRLRQVLINILGNAVKFTRAGYVKLSVKYNTHMLCFNVSDTGIGIKKEDIAKIFNDFEQLESDSTRKIGGTGLGLSIAKSLVQMMWGKISIESEYGKGTEFRIEVPFVLGIEDDIEDKSEADIYISAPDAKILIVDDTEVNLNVTSGLFKLFDINCELASSGREAIDMIAANKYDIVFMDHMMPEMDGVEATEILRKTYGSEELIIVALTANVIEGVEDILLAAGMNDYLSKPIDKKQLNKVLLKWLPERKVSWKNLMLVQEVQIEDSALIADIKNNIRELDVNIALRRVNGMGDVFEKSLMIMTKRLPDVCDRLSNFLESEDLRGFSIEVHGAKGSLNNVGATEYAKLAEELEIKSKSGDMQFCQERLPKFIAKLKSLHKKLDTIINGETNEICKPKGSRNELQHKLKIVRTLLDGFEDDEAIEILNSLGECAYDEAGRQLNEIINLIEQFEYEKAIAIIDDLNI